MKKKRNQKLINGVLLKYPLAKKIKGALIMADFDLHDIFRIDRRGSLKGDGTYNLNELTLQENVVDALKNRLSTPRGKMPFRSLYGTRLEQYIGESSTPELLNSIASEVENQCKKDFRVRSVESVDVESKEENQIVCNVSLTLINTQDTLEFRLVI